MNDSHFGNYRVARKLGSGGMGDVFEAVDEMLERTVAVKVLRPELASQPELMERFRVEAVTLAKLNHPSVAQLYAFFRQDQRYCMVMEFVRGKTLEELLATAGRMEPRRAAEIMAQTLDGVAHAHAMGVMHRDIKPANIMITDDGRVKVTDFGIARILGASRMTREGRIIGTLEYIAPERIEGIETDARSDLYSAGVVLYEMLTGRLPFVANTDYALMQAQMHTPPPPFATLGLDCPAEIEAVVQCAMQKRPEARFQSSQAFQAALISTLPALATASVAPTRLATPMPAAVPARRRKLPWAALAVAGVAIVAVGAGAAAYYLRRQPAVVASAVAQTPVPVPAPVPVEAPQVMQPAPAHPLVLTLPQQTPVETPAHAVAPATRALRLAAPAKAPASNEPNPAPTPVAGKPQPLPPVARETPPAPAPPAAPAALAPAAPRSLRQVRKLYITKMDDDLDDYLREEISAQLGGRLRLVTQRGDADAVLSGRGQKKRGFGSKVSLGFRAGYSASVAIKDMEGASVLWSAEADDSRPGLGAVKRGGARRVAERLVETLKNSLGDAR